ncbi:hypothetical protein AB0B25_14945 [Nocardia sp. NPDC049190]|uniref:hypothetical protein n=1 Tax=Nocardia sp. NPDC049190 TaxID=3155650 RepID=UPI0033D7ADCA
MACEMTSMRVPWVTGDEVYGGDPKLGAELESRRTGYVFAVSCDHHATAATGRVRADILAATLPKPAPATTSADPENSPDYELGLEY